MNVPAHYSLEDRVDLAMLEQEKKDLNHRILLMENSRFTINQKIDDIHSKYTEKL